MKPLQLVLLSLLILPLQSSQHLLIVQRQNLHLAGWYHCSPLLYSYSRPCKQDYHFVLTMDVEDILQPLPGPCRGREVLKQMSK